VHRRMSDFLRLHDLLPRLQSAYRRYHSTETAVLKVLSDILYAIDTGDLSVLALLDLSAAFDTVDHGILLQRLETSFGVGGLVLDWFRSYLTNRVQYVRRGTSCSAARKMWFGLPQGSVLGPLLWILYTVDLICLVEEHGFIPHMYADDTQINGSCQLKSAEQLQRDLSSCLDDVSTWMCANRLQLNTSKTEVIWCATPRRQQQLPTADLRVGSDYVRPSKCVRNLGIFIDSDVTMRTHVTRTVASCFATLRQLRTVRRSVSDPVFRTMVVSLVLSRLDYGNATLAGIPAYQHHRLQSVMNAAAKLIHRRRRYDHVTPLLHDLHWLKSQERVDFKLAVTVYKCLHGLAPQYLVNSIQRVAESGRRQLRSSSTEALVVPFTRLITAGDRAFSSFGSRLWNSLPRYVTAATTLSTFRSRLKTYLFKRSFLV
jgi:hypothetical protein